MNLNGKIIIVLPLLMLAWLDPYADRVMEGNGYYEQRQYDRAEKSYRAAERYAPGVKERNRLQYNFGNTRYMEREYEKALEHYGRSLESGDREVQKKALFNMGNALTKAGKNDEAVRAYIDALKVDPGYLPAKRNLEYLLKNPDTKKQTGPGSGREDGRGEDEKKGRDGRDPGEMKREQNNEQQRQATRKETLNRDQVDNLLRSMKNKPVRREKGKGDDRARPEKFW